METHPAPPNQPSTELVLPGTGEVINLDDPAQCARALGDIRALEGQLRDIKTALTTSILIECSRQGSKTLDIGGGQKAEVKGGSEVVWDYEKLGDLLTAGLPLERFRELVVETIERKVDARVAKQLAGANAEYGRIIEAARSVYEKPAYVSIRRA